MQSRVTDHAGTDASLDLFPTPPTIQSGYWSPRPSCGDPYHYIDTTGRSLCLTWTWLGSEISGALYGEPPGEVCKDCAREKRERGL
jgi:hypothetical protein